MWSLETKIETSFSYSLIYSLEFELVNISTSKKLTNLSPDPNRDILPTWAEVPAEDEIAIEGKRKALYCMAYGK